MWHPVILLTVTVIGLIAGFAVVVATDMFVLVDVSHAGSGLDPDEKEACVEAPALPSWLAATVLLVAELLSLGAFSRSQGLLSYLALFLVLFSLFAIALLDMRWQLIPIGLFIPLGIGSITWVLLHPVTIWVAAVSGGLSLVGVMLWLLHPGRRNYGDLLLAVFVGLFCSAGITNSWQALLPAARLSFGMAVGWLAILIYTLLTQPSDPEGKSLAKRTIALGPVFLSAALFVVFLR